MDEAHCAEARVRAGAVAGPAQMRLDDAQQDLQHGAEGLWLSLQVPAQALVASQRRLADPSRALRMRALAPASRVASGTCMRP
jgi:hypothetical protein